MIRRPTMRRAFVAALASASLLAPIQLAAAQEAQIVPLRICDHDWREGTWHVKQLIWCAARRWNSPGTPRQAIEVARCESNLNPHAYSSGGYAGLSSRPASIGLGVPTDGDSKAARYSTHERTSSSRSGWRTRMAPGAPGAGAPEHHRKEQGAGIARSRPHRPLHPGWSREPRSGPDRSDASRRRGSPRPSRRRRLRGSCDRRSP